MNPSPTPYPTPTPPGWPTLQGGPGANPLKGFMPFSDPQFDNYFHGTDAYVNQMPHNMEFFYIPLNAVMLNYHVFEWHALDSELRKISGRQHQAVVRFYLDYPDKPSGIPQFLLNGGLVTHSYPDYNSGVDATSVIPNYDDLHLLMALDQLIAAFGARYDGDPRIGFIQIGLIGFWGEWHTYPYDGYSCNATHTNCPNYMPNAIDQSRVLLVGVRQVDPAEQELLEQSQVMLVRGGTGSDVWTAREPGTTIERTSFSCPTCLCSY